MGRATVQQAQVAAFWIQSKRAYGATGFPIELGGFVYTKEPISIPVNCEEGWVRNTFCNAFNSQFPRIDIKKAAIYPLAFSVRICTDKEFCTAGACREPHAGREFARCDTAGNPDPDRFDKIATRDSQVHKIPRRASMIWLQSRDIYSKRGSCKIQLPADTRNSVAPRRDSRGFSHQDFHRM
jgi:hypothetical protein